MCHPLTDITDIEHGDEIRQLHAENVQPSHQMPTLQQEDEEDAPEQGPVLPDYIPTH